MCQYFTPLALSFIFCFFLNHWKVFCIHCDFILKYFSEYFLKQDILLHDYNMVTNSRKFKIYVIVSANKPCIFSFASWPQMVFREFLSLPRYWIVYAQVLHLFVTSLQPSLNWNLSKGFVFNCIDILKNSILFLFVFNRISFIWGLIFFS